MDNLKNLRRTEIEKLEEFDLISNFIEMNSLNLNWISNFKQIIYHYINNLTFIPSCRCGNKLKFKSFRVGYRINCSFKCSANSDLTKSRLRESRYNKYGDSNYNNSKKMLQTKEERYGDKNFNNREKALFTNIERYGYNTPTKNENVKRKTKKTKLLRYGNENYNNIKKIKDFWNKVDVFYKKEFSEKVKQTKFELYGDEGFNNATKMVRTKIKKGILKDENDQLKFNEYKNKVRSRTNTKRKKLFKNWNGIDYYTGEYIKENLNLEYFNSLYPTIDHKIPILICYQLGISVEKAADLENLCITSRYINSKKKAMKYEDFLEKLKFIIN
jgi:hypothetical protein